MFVTVMIIGNDLEALGGEIGMKHQNKSRHGLDTVSAFFPYILIINFLNPSSYT